MVQNKSQKSSMAIQRTRVAAYFVPGFHRFQVCRPSAPSAGSSDSEDALLLLIFYSPL